MTNLARRWTLLAWTGGLALGLAWYGPQVPAPVRLAATVPAVVWTLVVCWAASRERKSLLIVTMALVTGAAVAVWPSSHASQAVLELATSRAGGDFARRVVPGLVAPVIEEFAKALGLFAAIALLGRRSPTVVGGMLLGALVGIGFTWRENLQYLTLGAIQGGTTGLWYAAYVRGVLGGLHHAVFAATTGAGLAFALRASIKGRRWLAAGAGLAAATLQHLVWNALVAPEMTEILCAAERVGGPCRSSPEPLALFVVTPLLALAALVPGIAALVVIAVRTPRLGQRPGVAR